VCRQNRQRFAAEKDLVKVAVPHRWFFRMGNNASICMSVMTKFYLLTANAQAGSHWPFMAGNIFHYLQVSSDVWAGL